MEQLNIEKLSPQVQEIYTQLADTIAYERADGRIIVVDAYATTQYRSVSAYEKTLVDTWNV